MTHRIWITGTAFLVVLGLMILTLLQLGCTPADDQDPAENDPTSPTGPGQTTLTGTYWLVDVEWENDLAIAIPDPRVLPGDEIIEFDGDTLKKRTRRDRVKHPIEVDEDTLRVYWGGPGPAGSPQPFLVSVDDDTIRMRAINQQDGGTYGETDVYVKRSADLDLEELDTQLREKVQAFWADPVYRELEYRVATDTEKLSDFGLVYQGSQSQWEALAWEDKEDYLPWTFVQSLPRHPEDQVELTEYCRSIAVLPEQFGYLWSDWLGDRTMDQLLDDARHNQYRWPGGSATFDSILELYDTQWSYPGE